MAHPLTSVFSYSGFLGVSIGSASSQMFLFAINIARGSEMLACPCSTGVTVLQHVMLGDIERKRQ